MFGGLTEGFATSSVDGGVQIENALSVASWALTSPGNVDYNALQNFAFNGLIDGAMATKQVIESFHGHGPDYSYWNGCSQGDRQGYMFAQKFPEVFDGIAAAAPAINWSSFFFSSTFPQQVLSEPAQNGLKRFPHECEFLSLRRAAIAACDANGRPVDGLISDMASCKFDARSMIGSPSNCSSSGTPSVISEAAVMAMNALWQGAQTSDRSFLWCPHGYQTDPTAFYGTLDNTCSDNGTCVLERNTLFTHWIKYFVEKDPDFDLNSMTRQEFVRAFNAGTRDYNSIIDTDYPDLRDFRAAGGKLLTYHGLPTNRSHMVERATIMIEYLLSILPYATFTVISKSSEQHTVKLAKVMYLPACLPLWSTGLRMVLRLKRLLLGTLKIKNVCFVNTRRRQFSLETPQTTLQRILYANEGHTRVAVKGYDSCVVYRSNVVLVGLAGSIR